MKDKENQIEEMTKLDIEESAGFYSAFINDMRISKNKPLSTSKTIMSFNCPKNYILQAIGIPEDSVVLSREEYAELKQAKTLLEFREETIKFLEEANIRYSVALENKGKETAEKFESELKAFIKVWKMAEDDAMSIPFYRALFEKIGELAKKSVVDIKE